MAPTQDQRGEATAAVDDWDAHWDDLGCANRRNPAQRYRRRLVLHLLGRYGAPERLLDLGSGNGELLAAAGRRWPGAELAGVELSAAAVAQARQRLPEARLRVGDLIGDPAPGSDEVGWATHAACSEVLEHVDDPLALLRNARAWLAPGGRLVVTVPGGPMSAFDRHIGHRRHFSPAELSRLMSTAGLQVALVTGAGWPVFNLYRGLVIARGSRLVSDAAGADQPSPGGLAMRAAMAMFGPLLALSLPRSPAGWQTIGVARQPGGDTSPAADRSSSGR